MNMGSLNLNLGGVGKGISAEVAFITGLETIRERNPNLLLHDLLFLKEIRRGGLCLEEVLGHEVRRHISNDFTGKTENFRENGALREGFVFPGTGYVYPHLDKTPALFPMNDLVALVLEPKNGKGTPVASRARSSAGVRRKRVAKLPGVSLRVHHLWPQTARPEASSQELRPRRAQRCRGDRAVDGSMKKIRKMMTKL